MKQTITRPSVPTAQICINKSRLKVYNKETDPTYYLEKGQEFQIEIYNPTSDTILAKIYLNGKAISQGGLVLRPAERVFLERYLDVAKKFLFDTYEVANTSEAIKAIESNGDFKVEFFKESNPVYNHKLNTLINTPSININPFLYQGNTGGWGGSGTSTLTLDSCDFQENASIGLVSSYVSNLDLNSFNLSVSNTADSLYKSKIKTLRSMQKSRPSGIEANKKSKSIETGRVEAGSQSNQQIKTVEKSFDYFPFHTTEYKMLPVSQKVNTIEDINVKRYCHHCGAKQKPEFKFCPSCGKKC